MDVCGSNWEDSLFCIYVSVLSSTDVPVPAPLLSHVQLNTDSLVLYVLYVFVFVFQCLNQRSQKELERQNMATLWIKHIVLNLCIFCI